MMITKILNQNDVLNILPERPIDAHKGNFGKILLLCGSKGYTGAAALAAMGALRSGAGLVYLGVPESIYQIEAIKLTEPIVFPLPECDGMFSLHAVPEIERRLAVVDVVLLGPGVGNSPQCRDVVAYVLNRFPGPVVLDADGINVIAGHKDIIRERTGITVLTPHAGEFQRLYGKKISNRRDDAVTLAKDLGAIVLLKGHETLITDGRTLYMNTTGNPGMAVGGSGDVLAGMITGLLGQKISPLEATACAAWLHGRAGDLCAEAMGQYAMLPTDMMQFLPQLLK